VIVGSAGAGKSTTAAAFASIGYPILSDDIAPIREKGREVTVGPGSPRICLRKTLKPGATKVFTTKGRAEEATGMGRAILGRRLESAWAVTEGVGSGSKQHHQSGRDPCWY